MKKLAFAACLALMPALPLTAQEAVPLTYELLEMTWAVTEYEGRVFAGQGPAMVSFAEGKVSGVLPCGGSFTGRVSGDLPVVAVQDLQGSPPPAACDQPGEDAKFLDVLGRVVRLDTTPEGLGYFDAADRRLMLGVLGG